MNIYKIAHIENDMTEKFGIPRQSGMVKDVISTIVFEPAFRNPDAIRGLEGFTHIWILWEFESGSKDTSPVWSPTVRPPKLGGNTRMGVFATRSPNRPNPIGLSCVRILEISESPRGPLIKVEGADLRNNTPIFDIKPYLPFCDSHPEAGGGFTEDYDNTDMIIDDPDRLLDTLPEDKKKAVRSLLLHDPRPSYHNDPGRIYGMNYGGYDIRFCVDDYTIFIREVVR